jgi:hypothetical protein
MIVALVLLAGCGFQPLYGTTVSGSGATEKLGQIRIDPIPDRIGQQIRNFLLDRLNPYGQPARPVFRLIVKPTVSSTDLGIERDETATRNPPAVGWCFRRRRVRLTVSISWIPISQQRAQKQMRWSVRRAR